MFNVMWYEAYYAMSLGKKCAPVFRSRNTQICHSFMKLETVFPIALRLIVHRDRLRAVGRVMNYSNTIVHFKGVALHPV